MMLMELCSAGLLGERVTEIAGGPNIAKDDLLVFNPSEDCKLFEFNMAGASGGVLGVGHKKLGAIVVLVVLAHRGGQELFHA
jgi:hypothetical protein